MEMRVIATHMVKPSSPTPNKSKHHKLARPDQLVPSMYIPLIFFYQNDRSDEAHRDEVSITQRLKESLSEILTAFYPLAGTLKGNSFVDCDDTGAEFVEARVHGRRLAPFIQNPNMEELEKLVPVDSSSHNDNILLSVKISYFDCGGFAAGACLSHKIGDAASLVIFMNAWAARSREESSRMIQPSFDLAVRFPPSDEHSFIPFSMTRDDKITMKRLVFEGEKIEKLRQEAAASSSVKNPSRVEAVSAFISGNFIEANKGKCSSKSWTVTHAVNIRSRTDPPMPEHTVGNCVVVAAAVIESSSIGPIVSNLRAAIRAACDKDYIHTSKAQEDVENVTGDSPKPESSYFFSSWCRFPVYDVDFFGWGKPVWVATAPLPLKNLTYMISTPSGDGIEAWIYFDREEDDHFFQLLQANPKTL